MGKRIPWSRRLSKGVFAGFDHELFGGSRLIDPEAGEKETEMTQTGSKLAALLLLAWPIASGQALPPRGPLPEARPAATAPSETSSESASPAPDPADVPTPESKPAVSDEPGSAGQVKADPEGTAKPGQPAQPGEPANTGKDTEAAPADGAEQKTEKNSADQTPPDPPPQPEDPQVLAACLADLKEIGTVFAERPAIDDETGCGIAAPITVTKLLPDVALEPEATMRCETALQLARMTRDLLKPAAETAFPGRPKLTAIRQASAYVCRNRNSAENGKVSEHAYGNAIDIAALRFGDEEQPVMIARQDDGTANAAFQRAFNAIACLYFTTVLSPGSDATHQDHMHLDVIKRKSGFRYCR
jgi:hypothetical protein